MKRATTPSSSWLHLVLMPAMRFCVRRTLRLQEIVEAAKITLVDAAIDELSRRGEEPSASKISVMTGVHRPDVTRLLKSSGQKVSAPATPNIIARIIGQWQSDPRFALKSGKPKELSVDGAQSEFAALVHSVSSSLSPYTILFELERSGVVLHSENSIALLKEQLVEHSDREQAYRYLSRDASDLISAIDQNIDAQSSVNLHLQTEYDRVAVSSAADIRTWLLAQGKEFHARARKYISKFDRDLNPKLPRDGPTVRVAVCSFSIVDDAGGKADSEK